MEHYLLAQAVYCLIKMFHVEHLEELIACPVCGGDHFDVCLVCKDYTVSHREFNIVCCKSCGFKFTNPRPQRDCLGEYYKSQEYISHSNTSKGIINALYQTIRKYTLIKKLQLVESVTKSKEKSILDVGCGTGEFLSVCKHAKWEGVGIEPNNEARNFAINAYGISVHDEEFLDELPSETFTVITLWHVLEHVSDLSSRIEELKRILKSAGKLIIAVPNCQSLDANIYGKYWAAYDVPRHLYHFTAKDITSLFHKHEMKVDRILPMIFDSFYVSMLSEKYKYGKSNIVRAFWNGLRSNIAAINKPHDYSSQIYILSKI